MNAPQLRIMSAAMRQRVERIAALNDAMQAVTAVLAVHDDQHAVMAAIAASGPARPVLSEAHELLDALCQAARLILTDRQRAAALDAIDRRLAALHRRWTPPVRAIGRRIDDR